MTSSRYLQTLRKRLQMTEQGRLLLEEKPLISEESLNAKVRGTKYSSIKCVVDEISCQKLRLYDSNTFGKHYIDFMDVHHISADSRAAVKFESDSELAYILMRCRQIHDFWHVLLGLPPSVLGEVALKRFEAKVISVHFYKYTLLFNTPSPILFCSFPPCRLSGSPSRSWGGCLVSWL